jgi:hypothetical protein
MINANGNLIYSQQEIIQTHAWNNLIINFPLDIKSGMYFLKIFYNNEFIFHKVIITE